MERRTSYVAAIQHVRRRETVAMTPADSLIALQSLFAKAIAPTESTVTADKKQFSRDKKNNKHQY
jgi:hypothetical protein